MRDRDQLTLTLSALADPTRREMLARLTEGEKTVAQLADPFDLAPPSITKHLKVLERAGLIERSKRAQYRPCRLKPAPLKQVAAWVEQYRRFWEASFDRLEQYLTQIQSKEQEDAK